MSSALHARSNCVNMRYYDSESQWRSVNAAHDQLAEGDAVV